MPTDFEKLISIETPDGVVITTTDGKIVHWTRGAETVFGYTSDEALGNSIEELVVPMDRIQEEQVYVQKTLAEGSANYEALRRRRDGSLIYVDVTSKAIYGTDGKIEFILFSKKDCTNLKVLRDAKLLEAKFRNLLESTPDGIVMVNSTGRIVLATSLAEKLFSYGPGELRGQLIESLIPERFRGSHLGHRRNFFAQPRARSMGAGLNLFGLRKDGTEFPVEVSLSPLQTDEGLLVMSAIRDITDRKLIERNLQEKNIELENANLAKDRFLTSMSHELRTPLNAIIGFSEVLIDGLMGELTAEQKSSVADILGSGEHLLSLINDILDLSKVEAGKMKLELEALNVAELVRASVRVIKERAMERQLKVSVEASEELGDVWLDARKCKQILYNLLANAVKFTPDGGEVHIIARQVGSAVVPDGQFEAYLELAVRDTGIGIAEEDKTLLFQPFSQIDSSLSRRYEGTGLGLVMVKKLAELHSGTVAVQSIKDKGSTFTVWLPWRKGPDDESAREGLPGNVSFMADFREKETLAASPAMATARDIITRMGKNDGLQPLALVVEDDDMAASLLRVLLESSGFRVIRAATGERGLELAADQKPALITLDIMLPGMSGWEFLEHIKADPQLTDIPVIIETILSTPQRTISHGISIGATRILQKPVRREELIRVLDDIGLTAKPEDKATVLVVDDDPVAVELLGTHLDHAGYSVLRAYGGKDAVDMVRRHHPDLMILDLMMPGMSGFDVIESLEQAPPTLVVTAKTVTPEERQRLNGHVQKIMEKSQFDREHFLSEVRRAMSLSDLKRKV